MVSKRKIAFNSISRVLAITRYDIEHHQSVNDLSLNIHGENYFRDVFNHVYGLNLQNANFESFNFPSIDLIDKENRIAYQITTTKSREKIDKTLEIYNKEGYDESFISNLRELIIDKFYKDILFQSLERIISKSELIALSTSELQFKAQENETDFNRVIANLYEKIETQIGIQDFNSMSTSWIIIAYFFELCDVGVHKK